MTQIDAKPLNLNAWTSTRKSRSLWSDAWHQFTRHRLAMTGLVVLNTLILAVLVGPFIYGRRADGVDFSKAMLSPSWTYPFGMNDIGQDLLARTLWGGRISLAVGASSVLTSILIGTLVGALSGFFGGRLDSALMRLTDLFLSIPQLPFLMTIIYLYRDLLRSVFGPELGIFLLIVFVIGLTSWMSVARLVRAAFLSIKGKEYIEAAICVGVQTPQLIFRHILPNALSPVIVAATIGVGSAIITESTLSFLGLGFPPDVPSWGRLLLDAQNFMDLAPHMVIFPGTLVALTVLSINFVGDGLRDALDPRMRL